MREIKFRGKCLFKGDWWIGSYAHNLDETKHYIIQNILSPQERYEKIGYCLSGFAEIDINTLGQFIGLKDINGKKIYTGDIIRDVYGHLNVIIFNKTLASYQSSMIFKEPNRRYATTIDDGCEIIGNIYENPDLLEVSE